MSPRVGWLDEERDAYLAGLLRLGLAGLLLFFTLKQLLRFLNVGYFGEVFHIPVIPEAWVPNRLGYGLILGIQIGAALLAMTGRYARPALLIASGLGLFGLLCNRLDYHNNRYVLLLFALLAALAPSDRSFVLGRAGREPAERRAPVFALRLLAIQLSLIYVASAGGKLLDPDWRGGQVLHVRYEQGIQYLAARGQALPGWIQDLLASFGFANFTSKAAIATELGLAFALWGKRTRALALWVGTWFHVGIELLAHVELFSFIMLTGYIAFVRPELEEREFLFDPTHPLHPHIARWCRRLDWLARFRYREHSGPLAVVDRDGQRYEGGRALQLIARAVPALFPSWLPIVVATRLWLRLAPGGHPRGEHAPDVRSSDP